MSFTEILLIIVILLLIFQFLFLYRIWRECRGDRDTPGTGSTARTKRDG